MATPAVRLYRAIQGVFAVYKPQGMHWKLVRDTLECKLLAGINSAPPPTPRLHVKFLPLLQQHGDAPPPVVLTASLQPVLADHPLATGAQFQKLRVGVGHRLDAESSGVMVLGVGRGNVRLTEMYQAYSTRDYTIQGEFGKATEDFSHQGRLIERTTYDHITLDKLDRVLAMLRGANQKALLSYSGVDMQSQQAYELAVRGLLRPQGKSPPIVTRLHCLRFEPPHITLEVECVNETQRFLRKLVHEVGLELRSSAVCTGVRRTRDGPFTLEHALTHRHWTHQDVVQATHNSWEMWRDRDVAKHTTQDRLEAGVSLSD